MSRLELSEEALGGTRGTMRRAMRRIGILEVVVLGVIMVLAMVGGAMVAALLTRVLGVAFGGTWIACSVLLFSVPAFIQLRRTRAPRITHAPTSAEADKKIDG